MNQVAYLENALVITIPTNDPAQLHLQLLRAITATLKHQVIYPTGNDSEAASVACFAELQNSLLPDTEGLEKIYQ